MADDEQPVDGCAWCGEPERGHGTRWGVTGGWHSWSAPDAAVLKGRMWYRRLTRLWARTKPVGAQRG